MKFSITIEGKLYGYMERPDGWKGGASYPETGVAFFCPTCARVWAVVQAGLRDTHPYSIGCLEHPRFEAMPAGSVWLPWDSAWNAALPVEVLRRELDIHLTHWSRYNGSR